MEPQSSAGKFLTLRAVLGFYRWAGPIAGFLALFLSAGELAKLAGVELTSESYSDVSMLITTATGLLIYVGMPLGLILSLGLLRRFASDLEILIPAIFLLIACATLLLFIFIAMMLLAALPKGIALATLYVSAGSLFLFGVSATFVGWRRRTL